MKKFVAILLALLFILCGCSGNIVALKVGGPCDCVRASTAESEYALWRYDNLGSRKDSSAPKEMQTDFEGETYGGTYTESYTELGLNYIQDEYETQDGVRFSVRRDGGQLTRINFPVDFGGNKTFEECGKAAEEIAKKYIDISSYELKDDETAADGGSEKPEMYNFCYLRKIAGTETTDLLNILMNASGEIISFEDRTWSEEEEKQFELDSALEKIESYCSENALKKVEDKLKSLYPAYEKYTVSNKKVVCLKSGGLGVLYYLKVALKEEKVGETVYGKDEVLENILVANSSDLKE